MKSLKLTDFISRLRGHLDIKGITLDVGQSKEDTIEQVYIRRAMLLRALIEEKLGGSSIPTPRKADRSRANREADHEGRV